MSEFLALASALSYGVADFLGGYVSKRRHVLHVLLVAHLVGTGVILVVALVAGGNPGAPDLWWGAAAGLSGLIGLGLFYWSLANGVMGVVAPVTAAVGGSIPVAIGFVLGERPAGLAIAGVVLALVAIVLISSGDSSRRIEHPSTANRVLLGSIIAGAGFGFFFVFLERVQPEAGMWPLVAARLTSTTVVILALLALRPPTGAGGLGLSAAAGFLDMSANAFVLVAFDGGLLIIVSALAALYPAVTVLLARFILLERLRPGQLVGLVLAIGSVSLISLA